MSLCITDKDLEQFWNSFLKIDEEERQQELKEPSIHFNTADEYLELVQDIFVGYDGYTKAKDLMELIDEANVYITEARKLIKDAKSKL